MRKLVSIFAIAVFAAACAAPAASPTPTPVPSQPASPSPSAPGATPSPTQIPSPSATPAPSRTPSPTPSSAAKPLQIDWKQLKAAGLAGLDISYDFDVASLDGRIVLVGMRSKNDPDGGTQSYPAIWWSDDGTNWTAAELPSSVAESENARLFDLTTWAGGFIAVGDDNKPLAVTSPDGRTWTPVQDPSLGGGRMQRIGATTSGLVAFGATDNETGVIWTSADGKDWLRATNETGLRVAKGIDTLVQHDGALTAFVHAKAGVEVWTTTGRADWTRIAVLVGENSVDNAAVGPLGWFASGQKVSWTSPDGKTWKSSKAMAYGGPAIIADAAGFIGTKPELFDQGGCAEPWPNFYRGETWTSIDGRKWLRLPKDPALEEATIMRMVVIDRTLLGIGGSYHGTKDNAVVAAVWSAKLPAIATASVKGDLPKPEAPSQGCGP